jgi:hypothetical protein
MYAYLFLGSFCTGKTTIIRKLTGILRSRGYSVISVEVNINHGLAYLVTRFTVSLARYKYIGNHYLTFRFNNPRAFCKYLPLMMLLDALFIPLKYTAILLRIVLSSRIDENTIVLVDEYYPNAIIDYEYFVNGLCREKRGLTRAIYSFFYRVAESHTIRMLEKLKPTLVVLISKNPLISMELWSGRERSRIFDYAHFLHRTAGSIVLASKLGEYARALLFRVDDPRRNNAKILKSLTRDILVR